MTFSPANRRLLLLLVVGHLTWGGVVLGLWSFGTLVEDAPPVLSLAFIALQLVAAAQLLLPVLLFHPEERSRGFYLLWGGVLTLLVWLFNRPLGSPDWLPLMAALRSGMLLLAGALAGAALARYLHRLWEIVPVCLVMSLADFASWLYGPTAASTRAIAHYYRAPSGPPPLVDMLLVKLALPGSTALAPVFGVSDWIMVVFFAIVARRHGVNDNLLGQPGERLARRGQLGTYLPVSVAALFGAVVLAQTSGLFIPALPLIALVMLAWYATRYLRMGRR